MGCLEHSQVPIRFLRQVRDFFKCYKQGNKQTQISKPCPRASENATFPLQAVPVALCKAIIYILSQLGIKSIGLPWLEEKQTLIYFRGKVCFYCLSPRAPLYCQHRVNTKEKGKWATVTSSACMKHNSLPSAELILNSAFTLHKVEQIHCTKYDLPGKIHGWLAAKLHGKLAQGWLNSSDAKKTNQNQEKNYFPVGLAPETAWFACRVRASRGRWIRN